MPNPRVEDHTHCVSTSSQGSTEIQPCVKKRKRNTLRLFAEQKNSIRSTSRSVQRHQPDVKTIQSPFIETLQQLVNFYIEEKDKLKEDSKRPNSMDIEESKNGDYETCGDDSLISKDSREIIQTLNSQQVNSILKRPSIEMLDSIKKVTFNNFDVVLDSKNQINQVETALSSLYNCQNCINQPQSKTKAPLLNKFSSYSYAENENNAEQNTEYLIIAEHPDIDIKMATESNDTSAKVQNMPDTQTVLKNNFLFEPNHDTPDETNIDEICLSSEIVDISSSLPSINSNNHWVISEQINIINEKIRELTYKKKLLKKKRHANKWKFMFAWFQSNDKLPIEHQIQNTIENSTNNLQFFETINEKSKDQDDKTQSGSPICFTDKSIEFSSSIDKQTNSLKNTHRFTFRRQNKCPRHLTKI